MNAGNKLFHLGIRASFIFLLLSFATGQSLDADPLNQPQTTSLFGKKLYAKPDTTGAIAAADSALNEAPHDVDRIIDAGRVRRHFWQYRQAIELYSRAITLAPDDWRAYRFRGHRFISVREFDKAVPDLERAREVAPMNWDVSYHLGLAYFLAGRFEDATNEYTRCLDLADSPEAAAAQTDDFRTCAQNKDDPESLVAMTEWAVRAAMRAGKDEIIESLLLAITPDMEITENVAYFYNLLYHKGLKTRGELLNPGADAPFRRETVGYGVATRMVANGEKEQAKALLKELVDDEWWPGFGRIAAEVELHRLSEK